MQDAIGKRRLMAGQFLTCITERERRFMKWYLLKTWEGREEALAEEIRKKLPSCFYKDCFVIYQERIWRKQQRSVVHVEKLFPGYVFLTSEKNIFYDEKYSFLSCPVLSCPEEFPALAGLAACGDLTILPMAEKDAEFLEKISGDDHMVKLSCVLKDENGRICNISDPLRSCLGQVERYHFKKRYAMVRRQLWGEDQAIAMGILLKEDVDEKLLYEDREISVKMSGSAPYRDPEGVVFS